MPSRPLKTSFIWLAVFAFLGFADATYLTAEHYLKLPLPCSITQGCGTVLTSKYAAVFGIPIAIFGALYYLTVLLLAVYLYTSKDIKSGLVRLIFVLTGISVLASISLLYLQFFVIKAVCLYCLGSAAFSFALFFTSTRIIKLTKTAQIY